MEYTSGLAPAQSVFESCQRLQDTFEMVMRPFRQMAEKFSIVVKEDGRITMKLINVKGKKVRFADKIKEVRDENSYHLVLLRKSIAETDENGQAFMSDKTIQQIFKKYHKQKNPRRKYVKDPKKQVWNATSAMLRFAGIPKSYNGVDIIKRVRGQGIIINNPNIEI